MTFRNKKSIGIKRMVQTQFRGSYNQSAPGQNGRHFADGIFTCIFLNKNIWISIKISLKCVPKGPMNNKSALIQLMAWRRTGDMPLSEPMPTRFTAAYMRHQGSWVNKLIVSVTCEFSILSTYFCYKVHISSPYNVFCYQWPLLLKWFNFNPSMDK